MAIYRGPGGSGDAVNDSSSETRLAVEARDAAIAAQAAAEAAQAAAETAETNAETAETNAETAEANAETAEANAETAEANAEAAQAAAEAAQLAAETAQTAAELAETNAETAETNAETAASLAQDWATKLSTPVSGSDYSAKYNANLAAASATAAQTAETNAETAQSAAEAARDAALSAYDNFDDRYLGPKSSDPTLDNDGNALVSGALYFNTATNVMKVYTGSEWVAAYVSAAGVLLAANNLSDVTSVSTARTNLGVTATGADTTYAYRSNNLSDLASASTARTNLGLGTAATTAATDYATAAQGAKADTALQPAAIGVTVQAYDADTVKYDDVTANFTGTLQNSGSNVLVDSDIGATVQAYDSDLAAFAGKTAPTGDVVGTSDTQTLTNKTIALGSNTVSGTLAEFNTAITDADFVSIAGTETLTNKTLTSPSINGNISTTGLNFDSDTFVIDSTNNNIGIGTSSPQARLDVRASGAASNLFVTSDISTGSLASRIALGNSTAAARFTIGMFGTADEIAYLGTEGNFPLYFQTSGTERMRINSTGNVLIGRTTSSTTCLLEVAGAIRVNNNTDKSNTSANTFGMFFAKGATSITGGTGAKVIKNATGSEAAMYLVSGLSGGRRFFDIVVTMGAGLCSVLNSGGIGSPATRTYTSTSENLNLSLSGSDTYSILVTGYGSNEAV